ncbi:MAG: NUDIX hydrolase [Bacteroidales bacterium]
MEHVLNLFACCPKCGSGHFYPSNEKAKRCEDCGFVYYINPSAAVVAFICNDKGELLVAVRAKEPAKGTLDMPGGFTDLNETVEEAVAREVKEETNLDVAEMKYLFSLPNKYLYSGLVVPTMDLFFEVSVSDLSVLKAGDDVQNCMFISIKELDPAKFGLSSISKGIGMYKEMKMFDLLK